MQIERNITLSFARSAHIGEGVDQPSEVVTSADLAEFSALAKRKDPPKLAQTVDISGDPPPPGAVWDEVGLLILCLPENGNAASEF